MSNLTILISGILLALAIAADVRARRRQAESVNLRWMNRQRKNRI